MYRPKAVQIWASHGNPELRANTEGKQVDGFDSSFNVMPPEHRLCPRQATARALVARGARTGAVVEEPSCGFPGAPSSRGESCRSDHGGVECGRWNFFGAVGSPCSQLQLLQLLQGEKVNLNTQQGRRQRLAKNQKKSKKEKYSDVFSPLDFDRLAFMGTLVSEMENEKANRRSLDVMVKRFNDHPHDYLVGCQMTIKMLGRCFCDKPLLRWYDHFGRARLAFLES